jgi:hypothetical protein
MQYVFYNDIEQLSFTQVKRLAGVKHEIFERMLEVLNEVKAGMRKHPSRRSLQIKQ